MRRKTSLTLDEDALATARAGAEREEEPLSRWVERAILNEAARNDLQLIEDWERSLPADDQAVLAALAAADRTVDLEG